MPAENWEINYIFKTHFFCLLEIFVSFVVEKKFNRNMMCENHFQWHENFSFIICWILNRKEIVLHKFSLIDSHTKYVQSGKKCKCKCVLMMTLNKQHEFIFKCKHLERIISHISMAHSPRKMYLNHIQNYRWILRKTCFTCVI